MHRSLLDFASLFSASVLNCSIRKSTQPRRLRLFSLALKTALLPWHASSSRTGVPQVLAFVYTILCFHSGAGHFCLHFLSKYFVLVLSIRRSYTWLFADIFYSRLHSYTCNNIRILSLCGLIFCYSDIYILAKLSRDTSSSIHNILICSLEFPLT